MLILQTVFCDIDMIILLTVGRSMTGPRAVTDRPFYVAVACQPQIVGMRFLLYSPRFPWLGRELKHARLRLVEAEAGNAGEQPVKE